MNIITLLSVILSYGGLQRHHDDHEQSPVHSILWLIVVFFAISGHYIMLNAQFPAIVISLYMPGAIMVLFLFVVMLMNLNADSGGENYRLRVNWCDIWRIPVAGSAGIR